jgi:protein SMG8
MFFAKNSLKNTSHRLEHQKERSSLWPTVGDHGNHGGYCPRGGKNFQNMNNIRGRKSKGGKEFVVKIFVGVEYECPRGHRFMASAPDKVLKATGNGIVKDSGNKVTSNTADMPLYFACPCRFVELNSSTRHIHVNLFLEHIRFPLLDKLNNLSLS